MRLPLLSRVAAQVWGGGSGIAGEKLQTTHWPRLSGNRAGFIAACSFCFGFLRTDVRFWSRMLGSLARYQSMGPEPAAFWFVGSLHHQFEKLFSALEQFILDSPDCLFEPRSLFLEFGDLDDAICLSSVLSGRQAALDRGYGTYWVEQSDSNQIHPGHSGLTHPDGGAHCAFLLHAAHARQSNDLFHPGDPRHESFAQRAGNGFGVIYPNFKEDNPSKIVSGFGGTFCLVMSFLYIVGGILCLAIGSPWAQHATFSKPLWPGVPFACYLFSLVIFPTALGFAGCAIWKFDGWFSRCLEKSTACIKTPWSALQGALLSLSY